MRKLLQVMSDGAAAAAKLLLCIAILPTASWIFGLHAYCIQSGSMEPVLRTGSIIFTEKAEEIIPGDIVMFRKAGAQVTHRVLGQENGNYITKGDANPGRDVGTVSGNQMLGKVRKLPGDRYCIPYIGYLQAAVQEWKWRILGFLMLHTFMKEKKEVKIYDR